MPNTARQTRANRTITVDFHHEALSFQLLGDGTAFLECVLALLLALGFPLAPKGVLSQILLRWCFYLLYVSA